jgi:hypothetical protein
MAEHVTARRGEAGTARHVSALFGSAWQAGQGVAELGKARHGGAWQAWAAVSG